MRVLLADASDLAHWGFRSVLRRRAWVDQLTCARSHREAVELARCHRPHVAVVAIELENAHAGLCHDLTAASPSTRVLLMSSERISEARARCLGAAGVVPRTLPAPEIAEAARLVGQGRYSFPPMAIQPADLLTNRERAVVELVVGGATNREIGNQLNLSHYTVKDHLSAVYRKLGARNRADAAARARRLGLLG
jgi:two-component system response regulator DesR